MSKSEIIYVKGMNNIEMSESDSGDGNEDIWDDRKLNDAYDKALRIANAEVAKRVAMSTNSQNENKEGKPTNKKDKPVNKQGQSKGNKKNHWKAGMPCRAVYEGDGIEYEAIMLRIINDKECVVRFLGYDNSEIVTISTLKQTHGKDEQTRQIEQALDDNKTDEAYTSQSPNMEKMDDASDRVPSPGSTVQSFNRKKKTGKKKKNQNSKIPNGFEMPEMPFPMPQMSALRNLGGSMDMPLPPPPPLALGARSECEEQAVSSMLLSWYMSGYYTGLYQGLKRAKENRRNV